MAVGGKTPKECPVKVFQFASKIHISTWYMEHHRTVAAIDLFFSLSLFVLGTTHAILQGEVHVVRHTRGCLAGDMYECSVIIDSHLVESTRPSPGRGVLRLRRTYRVGKAFSITPRGSLSLSTQSSARTPRSRSFLFAPCRCYGSNDGGRSTIFSFARRFDDDVNWTHVLTMPS